MKIVNFTFRIKHNYQMEEKDLLKQLLSPATSLFNEIHIEDNFAFLVEKDNKFNIMIDEEYVVFKTKSLDNMGVFEEFIKKILFEDKLIYESNLISIRLELEDEKHNFNNLFKYLPEDIEVETFGFKHCINDIFMYTTIVPQKQKLFANIKTNLNLDNKLDLVNSVVQLGKSVNTRLIPIISDIVRR
ncbi:hypothetical protein CDLVIII_3194 [Clostridium sp. DL-VIII]|uniref:hypothetical protein n=1 Tax=Clostridium sp. DL-VIII TaxID=641107 RepID=UPI00023AFFC7|nr:hypothetical protein [Clostridium sp. DL-VIII]EHI99768.1 hypothetical protein CDLVIII_3194 [Clostridium sp. DL-VIII]